MCLKSLCSEDDVRIVLIPAGVQDVIIRSNEWALEGLRTDPKIQRKIEACELNLFSYNYIWHEKKGQWEDPVKKHFPWLTECRHLFLLLFTGLCEFIKCNMKGKLRQATYGILYKAVSFQAELDLNKF